MVSFRPFSVTRLPNAWAEVTPWETNTRSGTLGVPDDPPHETRFKPAHKPTITTRMRLFKRQAPNDMKEEVLGAKWWIIADPVLVLMRPSPNCAD